jgi:hypothetical protein
VMLVGHTIKCVTPRLVSVNVDLTSRVLTAAGKTVSLPSPCTDISLYGKEFGKSTTSPGMDSGGQYRDCTPPFRLMLFSCPK